MFRPDQNYAKCPRTFGKYCSSITNETGTLLRTSSSNQIPIESTLRILVFLSSSTSFAFILFHLLKFFLNGHP